MLSSILEKCVARLPNSKFRRWAVLELPAGTDRSDTAYQEVPLVLRELGPLEFSVLKNINEHCDDTVAFYRRFEKGNCCFVAELHGQPVFYTWVLLNQREAPVYLPGQTDMHVQVTLPSGWAYLWDAWTKESCRGRGIHPSATRLLWASLSVRGCTGFVALVNVNNTSSMRAFAKGGFRRCAILTHLCLFGCDLMLGRYAVDKEHGRRGVAVRE